MAPTLRVVDPTRLADVMLAAAVRASTDAVYLEPGKPGTDEEGFTLTFERGAETLAKLTIDALSGAAAVARLSFIAGIDLTNNSPSSAIVKVQTGDRSADVVITIRPGAGLRADLMVVSKSRQQPPLSAIETGRIGDTVGNYRLIERLGQGGMGTVFRVEHTVLGRQYALKVLRLKVVEKADTAAQRFVREARAASRVRHPNIVDVFDFGYFPDGRPYFVMELLEGENLTDTIRRSPLPWTEAVAAAKQIALALAEVHDHGVIHADVTPSNAFVVSRTPLDVKLVDFGLAAIADEVIDEENSDFVLGTPAYISPEQLHGLPATDRSDQYGLGCVLFEMIAGHPPYQHESVRELCLMHIQAPIPTVTSPHGPLPPKLADAITTMLQKSPQQRFPGLRAFIAVLEDLERGAERKGWQRWLST